MFSEVREFFGLKKELDHLGFFETTSQKHLAQELKIAIPQGRLIALSGVVGSGKTTFLQKLIADLTKSKEVVVSRSLAIESDKVRLVTLITALFYDLSPDKVEKVPSNSEKRERLLLELIKKARSPVALFVDDAHGLHSTTLVSLKRLIELVRSNGERLSVILAGHPKLKNDLRRPTLEEIGGRTQTFSVESIRGHEAEYIEWLLTQAAIEKVKPTDILEAETISYLAERLSTPLQIEQYLTLTLNEAYEVGEKPITADFMETILAIGLDEIEPNLIRHGYNVKSIARLLNVRPSQVRSFLHNQLSPEKTTEMREQILKIGIPI